MKYNEPDLSKNKQDEVILHFIKMKTKKNQPTTFNLSQFNNDQINI